MGQTPREVLADAVAATGPQFAADLGCEGAIPTGWVLVAEWVDSDGAYWMTKLSDGRSPSWRIRGLLTEAAHDLDSGSDD